MSAVPYPQPERIVELTPVQLRRRLDEALALYVAAMRYPVGTAQQRAPMWLSHIQREGWRCTAAIGESDELLGIGYGYVGAPGQWWHEQVRRGLTRYGTQSDVDYWLRDYFELTELHVLPTAQARGIGERVLTTLLTTVSARKVLLSTPEGPTRAWRLYSRLGFRGLLRNYQFTGDPRPFAVLGRPLPVD